MTAKNKPYKKKSFESDGSPNDISSNIYRSMVHSHAFKALSNNQKILYVYCKIGYYGDNKKEIQKRLSGCNNYNQQQINEMFVMNRYKWETEYEIYSNNGQFYKDIKALEAFGFVEVVENGKSSRTKTIYRFSDNWQTLAPKHITAIKTQLKAPKNKEIAV